jgi:hypothetical protein
MDSHPNQDQRTSFLREGDSLPAISEDFASEAFPPEVSVVMPRRVPACLFLARMIIPPSAIT